MVKINQSKLIKSMSNKELMKIRRTFGKNYYGDIEDELARRKRVGLIKKRRAVKRPQQSRTIFGGRSFF